MINKKDIIKLAINNFIDSLNKFLIVITLILVVVTIFIRNFYLDIIKILLIVIILFRLLSKNKEARRKENNYYLKIKKIILKPFSNMIRNFKDRKKYVYRKCSKCHTTLKLPLPKKRGINHASCPNCHNRVTIITFRKQKAEEIKVEVIKKKDRRKQYER